MGDTWIELSEENFKEFSSNSTRCEKITRDDDSVRFSELTGLFCISIFGFTCWPGAVSGHQGLISCALLKLAVPLRMYDSSLPEVDSLTQSHLENEMNSHD